MIVQGRINGGLEQGSGPALFEEIPYGEDGNTSPTPSWTTSSRCPWRPQRGRPPTRSRRHRTTRSAPRVWTSRRRWARPAIANAVVDALAHLGVTHLDIPITPDRVWEVLNEKGVAE